ncbi:hypothetical protein H5410_051614 [Solanum commersonii]|uniref:Uncharacterized protein n=1 Tax=Solanum commersonii TaxID=4109 RepID=A0A9J5WYX5_SOLCO|nr:hypothetical protein H5410_051614 [Solanum commersonii]
MIGNSYLSLSNCLACSLVNNDEGLSLKVAIGPCISYSFAGSLVNASKCSLIEQSNINFASVWAEEVVLLLWRPDCWLGYSLAFTHYPTKKKEMHDAIVALNDNLLSLFNDEQAKKLLKLKYESPVMVKKWRDLARSKSSFQDLDQL